MHPILRQFLLRPSRVFGEGVAVSHASTAAEPPAAPNIILDSVIEATVKLGDRRLKVRLHIGCKTSVAKLAANSKPMFNTGAGAPCTFTPLATRDLKRSPRSPIS
jgi:hypothetical protein